MPQINKTDSMESVATVLHAKTTLFQRRNAVPDIWDGISPNNVKECNPSTLSVGMEGAPQDPQLSPDCRKLLGSARFRERRNAIGDVRLDSPTEVPTLQMNVDTASLKTALNQMCLGVS